MRNAEEVSIKLTRGEAYDVLLSCVSAEIHAPRAKKWALLRDKIAEQLNGYDRKDEGREDNG